GRTAIAVIAIRNAAATRRRIAATGAGLVCTPTTLPARGDRVKGRPRRQAGAPAARSSARSVCLLPVEHDVQRALPQDRAPELAQLLVAGRDREEVVAGELAHLAREQRAAVGEQDLGLAVAARVEQDLARRGVAGVVLEPQARAHVAERDPGRLAAPAHVDDLLAERQQRLERLAGQRGVLALPAGLERERASVDRQVAHGCLLVGVIRRPGAPGATRPSS